MKSFSRADRVGGQIQREISAILAREVRDPRLRMTTITGVKMSADLRIAKIYFVNSDQQVTKEETEAGFQAAIGYMKRILSERLALRYMPELTFFYDESIDYGNRIDTLLRNLQKDHGPDSPTSE